MNSNRDLSVYLIYSSSQSAFKIGVSVDPEYRCSELRWSANNPWREVIETQLCDSWTFSREDALHVEASALERTQEIAFHHSEWRTEPDSGHDTLKDYMAETYHYIDEMSNVLPSYRGHGHSPHEEKSKLPKRRRTTVYIRDDYYRQAETAARYLKDRELAPKSISAFIDDAIGRELTRFAKAHNGGEPDLAATKPNKPKTVRATFHMPETLVEEVRDACYWVPGLTIAAFATDALSEALEKLKAEKGPFEKRPESFKGGRPIGS